jgi:hypothetical protein
MDLTFISLLRVLSRRIVMSAPNGHGACIDYASQPSAAIERGCSVGANHAQNRQVTSPDLTTGVAIARFSIVGARFNKRFAQLFPKADPCSKPQRTVPQAEYRRDLTRSLERPLASNGEAS